MDIDVLTGWSREIQAPMDPEGVNETYLQACWFTGPVLAGSESVCVINTGGKNEDCCWVLSSAESSTYGGTGGGTYIALYAPIVFTVLVGSTVQDNTTHFSDEKKKKMWVWPPKEIDQCR